MERLHTDERPRKIAVRVDIGITTIKKMGEDYKKSGSTYSKRFTNFLISSRNLKKLNLQIFYFL